MKLLTKLKNYYQKNKKNWLKFQIKCQKFLLKKFNKLLNKYKIFRDSKFYTIILNNDGACIAHPEEKEINISDKEMLKDLAQNKNGVATMSIDGETCMIFYGPIEFVNWSIAVIVPRSEIMKPMLTIATLFLAMVALGMIIVWLVCKK